VPRVGVAIVRASPFPLSTGERTQSPRNVGQKLHPAARTTT